MSDDSRLAAWSVRLEHGKPPVVYNGELKNDVAAVHSESSVALSRAMLIARAPTLRDAVRAAIRVFSAMAELGEGREKEVGTEMLPLMEAALVGIDDGVE